jgi:hypothetical protein
MPTRSPVNGPGPSPTHDVGEVTVGGASGLQNLPYAGCQAFAVRAGIERGRLGKHSGMPSCNAAVMALVEVSRASRSTGQG